MEINNTNNCCDLDVQQVEAIPTCDAMITSAINAYHALMTGSKEVEVVTRDQRVRYTEANIKMLHEYIKNLHTTCGNSMSAATLGIHRNRPCLTYFGKVNKGGCR
jgi:gpW